MKETLSASDLNGEQKYLSAKKKRQPIQVDHNQVGRFRREEGFRNSNDIYDLAGANGVEEVESSEKLEAIKEAAHEFVADMQELLKERFNELLIESRENAIPIPPEIIAYMEKTRMNLAQFSILEGESARSKIIEHGLDKLKDEDGLIIIFNLPKPVGQFWWKGGVGLWGNQAVDVDGKVIEWGYFYRKLMDIVWETVGYYESETPLVLRRLNAIGDHDQKHFYYVWEASLRK